MKKYIKPYYLFILLVIPVLLSVIVPSQVHADDSFEIVGWYDESYHDAVVSVKVNGVELSEYDPFMYNSVPELTTVTAQASETVNVEITLEDGYTFSSFDSMKIFLSGVQSEIKDVTNSANSTSIQLPSSAWLGRDQELYLTFKTMRDINTGSGKKNTIDKVVLNTEKVELGTTISDVNDFSPNIFVPSDCGYKIDQKSICWVKKEGINYIENVYPFVTDEDSTIIRLDITDCGRSIFKDDLGEEDITINNGELLDYELYTYGGPDPESIVNELCLTVKIGQGELPTPTPSPSPTPTPTSTPAASPSASPTPESTPEAAKPTPTPVVSEPTPAKEVKGTLLAKLTSKKSNQLVLSWNKIDGAEGYDIFFAKCNGKDNSTLEKVATISGNSAFKWEKKGLKKKVSYKAYVKAWFTKDGEKTYACTSPTVHAFTSGCSKNYTNPKSVKVKKAKVSIKKGKTFKIKASVKKLKKNKKLMPSTHEPKLRYISSDMSVATVSRSGKIKGMSAGTCTIYVMAANGVRKAVKVTVK
ncbi:MAG: Ig-like domain-containing protein [Eubacterium sp.]|nr:Ig-like domain-containing protein [Eubacterium sp.]